MAKTEESPRMVTPQGANELMSNMVDARARELATEAAKTTTSININTDAALYQTASEMNLGELKTDEIRFSLAGVNYIAQGFSEGILYVEDGNWSSFRKIAWATASAPSSLESGISLSDADSGGLSQTA